LQTERDKARVPLCESFLPELCLLRCVDAFLDPRREVFRREVRKRQQQITQITFGIDDDRGNVIDRGFLEEIDAQSGLAAAGHAHADGVRYEIFRVV
jgi:phosphoserine aminotransferase